MRHPRLKSLMFSALTAFSFCACASHSTFETTIHIEATNPLAVDRPAAETLIPLSLLEPNALQQPGSYATYIDKHPVANQIVDTNNDGTQDSLLLILDYPANSALSIAVTRLNKGQLAPSHPPLTQAEMAIRIGGTKNNKGVWQGGHYEQVRQLELPEEHSIGDKLIKYEGFGWESDLMAYRFYFDERGLIDIFGKRTPDLVLHNVGLDGDDYHAMDDWGMDILKVGPSLGLGAVAAWKDDSLQPPANLNAMSVQLQSGALQSEAKLTQQGWPLNGKPLDLSRRFSINAHSHLTQVQVSATQPIPILATGIVKHDVETIKASESAEGEWLYIATFGQQSLANDALGMALFFKKSDLVKTTEDKLNELALLKMEKDLTYYFAARWAGESNPVSTKEQFIRYLETTRNNLNHPIQIKKSNSQ